MTIEEHIEKFKREVIQVTPHGTLLIGLPEAFQAMWDDAYEQGYNTGYDAGYKTGRGYQ